MPTLEASFAFFGRTFSCHGLTPEELEVMRFVWVALCSFIQRYCEKVGATLFLVRSTSACAFMLTSGPRYHVGTLQAGPHMLLKSNSSIAG